MLLDNPPACCLFDHIPYHTNAFIRTVCHAELIAVMRELEYPRKIAIDNFATPNFELMADMLYWLATRYMYKKPKSYYNSTSPSLSSAMSIQARSMSTVPTGVIHQGIETEQDRVAFVNSITGAVATFFSGAGARRNDNAGTNTHLTVDAVRLYGADAQAVGELLKVANALHDAVQLVKKEQENGRLSCDADGTGTADIPFAAKKQVDTVTVRRQRSELISSTVKDIVAAGEHVCSQLESERVTIKPERQKALELLQTLRSDPTKSNPEHKMLETSLNEHLAIIVDELAERQRDLRNVHQEGKEVSVSLERQEKEWRHQQIRLQQMSTSATGGAGGSTVGAARTRPPFWDELEALEEQHEELYEDWIAKHKNIDYMERELEARREWTKQQSLGRDSNKALEEFRRTYYEQERQLYAGMFQQKDKDSQQSDSAVPGEGTTGKGDSA
jgi:clusterin-associated protein 1